MVEEKMKELMEIEQADKLQEEFEKFKLDCDAIMQKKKNLIIEFTKELDYRDQTYVDSMKQFHKDIRKMIKLMSEQFITLRDKMLTELNLIEDKFIEDRKDILDKQYTNYIKSLIDKLDFVGTEKEKELTNLQDTLEENAEMEAKKKEDDFIYRVILMETHLNFIKEKVEEFLYEIKILFEKLEYRIKIRDEKIKEAEEKKQQFKEMEEKITEKINKGMAKYRKKDKEKRERNSRLRNDLLKMTASYDALKEKFQHFEKHDELRFKEIYDMKSKEARELALKVVLADRTIKTQQLGRDNIPNDVNEGFTLDELQKDQEIEEDENNLKTKNLEAKKNANFKHNILDKISIPRVKAVFQCIIDEAEFLIDTKTIEECEGMTSEEKVPEYIESICRALNIKNEHELNELLALFYKSNKNNKKPGDENEENKENDDESENSEGKQKDNDDISFEKDNVLNILKEFSRVKAKKAKEKLQSNATSGSSGGGYSVEDNEEAKRERMKYLSETYWEKLGNTISLKTYNVWKALDNSLTAYHDLLFERKQLVENVKDLNEKHNELQKLLTQYMNSDINKDLIFPPHKSLKG
jgi:dynein regulatory complex protein 1